MGKRTIVAATLLLAFAQPVAAAEGGLEIFPDLIRILNTGANPLGSRFLQLLVLFVLLIYPVNRFVLTPLLGVLDERSARIEGTRKRAGEVAREADAALARYSAAVEEARKQAGELPQERARERARRSGTHPGRRASRGGGRGGRRAERCRRGTRRGARDAAQPRANRSRARPRRACSGGRSRESRAGVRARARRPRAGVRGVRRRARRKPLLADRERPAARRGADLLRAQARALLPRGAPRHHREEPRELGAAPGRGRAPPRRVERRRRRTSTATSSGIREATRRAAESERERILADAHAAAERIRRSAGAVVERELQQARVELRREAADLAVELAAKLLHEQVNDGDRARLSTSSSARVEREAR